ncbi:MAG: protein-glutamate O-methyltransferase family protein [Chloroflexi bacterium]|nr:protein-glutamate O-methyltransferase family protein [Chloroflexota bacterium]MCI0580592.1 protein-glutamate O-methyltransferase family protein [Chloroflexota bacterium]MCI0648886.1 protein-glutamate O-methyltransferase family protein [Chloroflexota bacterium]MCI0728216.1 protein-glutamate O-methyltransferase family protein [Chloroflexota bacterium]
MQPALPIPPPLRGAEIGSFTHDTVVRRLPEIGRRILAENDFPPEIVERLEALIHDIPDAFIRPLVDETAPDAAGWQRYVEQYIAPYREQNWLQVPWFFAETYFYRRILEATGYFQTGPGEGVDPFAWQKQQGLAEGRAAGQILSVQLQQALQRLHEQPEMLARLFHVALWGNQADLSLWPAGSAGPSQGLAEAERQRYLLVDDAPAAARYLAELPPHIVQVDVLADNAGFELVCDLGLVDFLLSGSLAETVNLRLKAHPTFVSDALPADVHQAILFLAGDDEPAGRALAGRLQDHLAAGRLALPTDFFWTSPLSGWEMPPALHQELGRASLVISKGDANYRRLLGDRHWPFTTPLAAILAYFPTSLLALRTLKSEVAAGLAPDQPATLAQTDPHWLTNGRWGVVQFVQPLEPVS